MSTSFFLVARYGKDLFFETLSAPLWWFTAGILLVARNALQHIARAAGNAQISVWIKNLLVPMYGQHDAWGRIISFIIRLANVIGRTLWAGFWSVGVVIIHLVVVMLPLFAFYVLMSAIMRIAA